MNSIYTNEICVYNHLLPCLWSARLTLCCNLERAALGGTYTQAFASYMRKKNFLKKSLNLYSRRGTIWSCDDTFPLSWEKASWKAIYGSSIIPAIFNLTPVDWSKGWKMEMKLTLLSPTSLLTVEKVLSPTEQRTKVLWETRMKYFIYWLIHRRLNLQILKHSDDSLANKDSKLSRQLWNKRENSMFLKEQKQQQE